MIKRVFDMGSDAFSGERAPGSLLDALLVYAEPLASGAYAVVVGDAESAVPQLLLDAGARSVHVFDPDTARAASASRSVPRGVVVHPFTGGLDVRDGAFDVAVIPDLAVLDDPRRTLASLHRAVGSRGAVVAMGRARSTDSGEGQGEEEQPFASEVGPAALDYEELYELFSGEFESVSLAGVVPFRGVVFAQLGLDEEAPAVSVDTRLASGDAPSVFVVVARDVDEDTATLDPYAIVQLPEQAPEPAAPPGVDPAAVAALQLRVGVLVAQLDEARESLANADVRTAEILTRLDRAVAERDAALTRAMELETILGASRQNVVALEARLVDTEREMLERDEQLAAAAQSSADAARLVSAEAALALHVADLAQVMEGHTIETAGYEEQLRERARVIAELERELGRRETLVKELVASLEESREGGTVVVFEAAAPLSVPVRRDPALEEEVTRLREKLDELAAEVARREGELTARAWRITELENERVRRPDLVTDFERTRDDPDLRDALERELARAQGEVDALRQALTQEHAARVAAESTTPPG